MYPLEAYAAIPLPTWLNNALINMNIYNQSPVKIFCLALSMMAALYQWSGLMHSRWSIIDDHEIMAFIGDNKKMPVTISAIGKVVTNIELNPSSTLQRFRPSYYVLRIMEAMVWGKNPRGWYLFRLLIVVFFSAATSIFFLRYCDPAISVGFILMAISSPYLIDCIGRLGPAEAYCMLGLGMVIISYPYVIKLGRLGHMATLFLAVGIIISEGSKENFLVLNLVPITLLLALRPKARLTMPIAIGTFPIIYGLVILCFVAYRLNAAGADVYQHEVSLRAVANNIWMFIKQPKTIIITGFILLSIAARSSAIIAEWASNKRPLLTVSFVAAIICIANYIYYSGSFVSYRYYFPYYYFYTFLLMVIAQAFHDLAIMRLRRYASRVSLLYRIVLPITLAAYSWGDMVRNQAEVTFITSKADRFTSAVNNIAYVANKNSNYTIYIEPSLPSDYERVPSVIRFLRAEGVKNPFFIHYTGPSSGSFAPSSLEFILIKEIEMWQHVGYSDVFMKNDFKTEQPITPISTECVSVIFENSKMPICARHYYLER